MSRVLIHDEGKQKAILKDDFLRETLSLNKLDTGYSIDSLREISTDVVSNTKTFFCSQNNKEGFWKYDDSDSITNDDGACVLVTQQGERIKRVLEKYIELSWFIDKDLDIGIDHTSAFNAAINASTFFQKPLRLIPDFTVNVNKSYEVYQSILGLNSVIRLVNNSTMALHIPILKPLAHNINFSGFKLDGNNINNRGTVNDGHFGIVAYYIKNFVIDNVDIVNTRHVGLLVCNCPRFKMYNSSVDNCGRYGAEMNTHQWDRIGCLIDNNTAVEGSEFYMGADCFIQNSSFSYCGLDGLVLGAGITVLDVEAHHNGIEFEQHDNGAAGIYIRPPQSIQDAKLNGLTIKNSRAWANTGFGIDLGNNEGSTLNPKVINFLISGCRTWDNYHHGIGVASGENGRVIKNVCYNNGVRAILPEAGTTNLRRAGIGVDCVGPTFPFKNIVIENNECYDSRDNVNEKTQQFGVYLGSNTKTFGSENLTIRYNDLTRNAQKPILTPSSNSPVIDDSTLVVSDNHGVQSFTIVPSNNVKLFPICNHLYVNPSSDVSLLGIENSIINNVVAIENVSDYNITLVKSSVFKTLSGVNIVLAKNKTVYFKFVFETGVYLWVQIPIDSSTIVETSLKNYAKPSSSRDILASDSINLALGLLERRFDDVSKKTATISSGTTTDSAYYSLVASVNMGANNYQDANLTLTFHSSVPSSFALVHFYMRQNIVGAASEMETSILAMSNERGSSSQGTVFSSDSFIIINNGYGTNFDIYVKKNSIYSRIFINKISEALSPFSVVTYHSYQTWIPTLPTTTYSHVSTHNVTYTKSRFLTSSDITLAVNDYYVYVQPSSDRTLTLPSALTMKDKIYCIKRLGSSSYKVTIVGTIEGVANYVMYNQDECLTLHSNGSEWKVWGKLNANPSGTVTLSAGFASVSLPALLSTSKVFLTVSNLSGTQGFLRVTKTQGAGFTITSSSSSDNSTIDFKVEI